MTKKEFKIAMLRGQGRCVQAAGENPERNVSMTAIATFAVLQRKIEIILNNEGLVTLDKSVC